MNVPLLKFEWAIKKTPMAAGGAFAQSSVTISGVVGSAFRTDRAASSGFGTGIRHFSADL